MGLVVAREAASAEGHGGGAKAERQESKACVPESKPWCTCLAGMGSKAMWSLVERHRGLDFTLDANDCLRLLGTSEACGELCPCAKTDDMLSTVDCLQLVGAAVCFSSTSRKTRLKALFEVFDFDRRGSLSFDEVFLLLDTCCAGIERFGGGRFIIPSAAELELVADILFAATPHERLSRAGFVNNSCRRARGWLQAFEQLTEQGGESMPFVIPQGRARAMAQSPAQRLLGEPKNVCGARQAFFMADGQLVRIVGPMLIASSAQPQNDGRENPGRIGWYHEGDIVAQAYSWTHDLIATACQQQVVVWTFPKLEPLAVVDTAFSTVALSWASSRRELCVADEQGTARVYSLVNVTSHKARCSNVTVAAPEQKDDAELDSEYDNDSESSEEEDSLDSSDNDGDSEEDREGSRRLISKTTRAKKMTRRFAQTRLEAVFQLPPGSIKALAHVEEDRILVCGRQGLAEILDVDGGEQRCVGFDRAPEVDFVSAAFHPRSTFAVLGADDGKLYVVEGYRVTRAVQAFDDNDAVIALHVCSRGFTTGSPKNGSLKLWSLNVQLVAEYDEVTQAPSLSTGAVSVCWSLEGSRIAVTTRACEVMLVHGVSGSVLGEGGVSCGHPGMERQFWLPESRLLTTGSDGTLRLWDMEGLGHLCSTCMVDRKVLVMTGRDVVKPKVMTLVALGHEDGLSVVARDDDAMVWKETFTVSEEGFAARLLTWSPCGQYLFAEDRVYDVWAREEFCRLPERVPIVKPQFWPAQGKGAWHVSFDADNAFEASRKSVLRKKGLRRIKLAVHAEEDAMGEDEPAPVHLVASEDDSGCFYSTALTGEKVILRSCTKELTFALRGRDEAPKDLAFFKHHDADESEEKNNKDEGKKKDKSGDANGEEEEEDNDDEDEEKEDAAPRSTSRAEDLKMVEPELVHYDRTVQGCKGAKGECIASIGDKGVVAYAASDMVVVAASRDGAARYLRMFAQVVCVRSCPVSEDAGFWWLVACDTLCVSVWRISVSEGALASSGGCALWARIRLEGANEVDASSSGTVAAVGGDHHVQVWRLQVDEKYSCGEGLFASSSPITHFPLVGTKSRISVLHVSGALVYVAELDVETGHIWVHETEGRKYRRRRATETSEVTCLWRDWCGDRSGSLWRVDGAQAKLFLLESKVHEGTGVALLRDGVSVSENGVVRLWTEKGVLENVVASEVIPGSVHGVCRGAIVVDGHRVVSLGSTNVEIASAHKKILSLCRSRSGLWASIGEIDASVCLWTRSLSLVNEVNLDPKGASKCTCAAFSQDSDLVAVGTNTGKVYIRSVSSKLSEDTKTLTSGAVAAGPEASATAVQCLAWSPASTGSESFRLVVGLEDGTMVFYDHTFGQVRKPLAPRGAAWRWPPRQVEFADDCEIVRMLDADGKACFADSVSANPIPEETLDKTWVAPESVAGVDVHVSVLRRGFPEMSLEEKVDFASDAVGALQARGRRSVVGVTHGMPRQFNARGELLRVGGDGAVSLDVGSGRQRAVGAAVPDVVDACAFSADARLVALVCRGPARVALVVDTVTGEPRSGPHKLGERLVVESIAVSEGGNLAMLARRMDQERDCRGDNDDDEAEEEEDATGDDDFEAARGSLVAIFIEADTSVQFEHVVLEDVRDRDEEVATRRGCSFLDERSFTCLGVASNLRVAVVLSAHEGALRVSRADTFLHELSVVSCGLAGDVGGHVHFLQEMEQHLEIQELQQEQEQEQEQEQDSDAKKEDDGQTRVAQVPRGYRGEICAHPGAVVSAISRQKSSQVWASADSMCRVRVWRKRVCIADVRVAEAVSMPDLAVDWDGIRITTFAQRIELEDPDRPQPLPFLGHSKRCSCATVSWCGRFVFTAGRDLVIRRWDVSTAQVGASASLDGIVVSLAYCGAHIYAITEDGVIQALDAEHLDLAHELKLPRASLKGVVSVPGTTSAVTLVDMDAQETFVLHTDSFNTVGPYPFPSQGAPKDLCVQRALVRGTACIVLP